MYNLDIDKTLEALNTQYQFCASAIIPRNSKDAPTIEQLSLIREAHLNIYNIITELKALRYTAFCHLA